MPLLVCGRVPLLVLEEGCHFVGVLEEGAIVGV